MKVVIWTNFAIEKKMQDTRFKIQDFRSCIMFTLLFGGHMGHASFFLFLEWNYYFDTKRLLNIFAIVLNLLSWVFITLKTLY